MRRTIAAIAITFLALVVPAAVAGAADHVDAVGVPQAAGLPTTEAPTDPDPSPLAPLLQVTGLVLLLGGAVVVASSWVSPAEAV